MKNQKSIIVKKVKKAGHGGHHGGQWKVAYADFVTAMMAFFLLLWLLSMVSDEKRARLSAYFKYFSLYDSGGTSWMAKSSEIFGESGENKQKVFNDMKGESISNSDTYETLLQNFERDLKQDIAQKLGDIKDQVLVDIVDEGIRIQMIDKEGSLMFERGNNKLTPKAREVLKIISEDIKNLTNKVIIEGHTDAVPYAGSEYSNWELSTERASSARKALESAGLDPKRISRVAGYADTDPFIRDNPRDPRNRRISIILDVPKKDNAKAMTIMSDQKQLKEASKELLSIIENEQILPDKANKVNVKTEKYQWPPVQPMKEPSPVIPEEMSPVIKKQDYDSMIKEGQIRLKNGDSHLTGKKNTPSPESTRKQTSSVKDKNNSPTIIKEIKELSNPVFQ